MAQTKKAVLVMQYERGDWAVKSVIADQGANGLEPLTGPKDQGRLRVWLDACGWRIHTASGYEMATPLASPVGEDRLVLVLEHE